MQIDRRQIGTRERHGAQKLGKKRRELEKVETDATLMDRNPDKYAAHLFLSSTHCTFASYITDTGIESDCCHSLFAEKHV